MRGKERGWWLQSYDTAVRAALSLPGSGHGDGGVFGAAEMTAHRSAEKRTLNI